MRVARSFEEIALPQPALLTIGTFDGVHRGHRFLLEQAVQRSREHGYVLLIVTFDPCPAVVLRPTIGRYQLTTAGQKLRLLEALGADMVVMLPFNQELAAVRPEEFMAHLEARVQLREMWLGEDFHFGRDRSGGLQMLVARGQEVGFSLHVVARRMEESASISSTRVRQALGAGDVEHALPLLGRPFAVELEDGGRSASSTVESAVYDIAPHLALPTDGVYAAIRSDETTRAQPVAVSVQRDLPAEQLTVWSVTEGSATSDLEFINRLGSLDEYRDPRASVDRASTLLEHWERPLYPASGNY